MLIGTKVCLGPIFQADGPVIFNWYNRVDVMRLDGLYRPMSQANFDDWFGSIGKEPSRVVFSIRKQGDLAFLGFIQISKVHAVNRTAEIGIMIGEKAHRGLGYGQEALALCIGFCWNELNLQRLSLTIIGDNPQALHVYTKSGFEREGLLRRSVYLDGGFKDSTAMALLRP